MDRYNLDGITLPTATNVRTPAIGWLDTIDHSLSDFAAILAIRPTAVGLAHRIAIHCRPGHEPREAQVAGPVLRLTGGFRTPTINLYVAPDAKDASARLFAHQWAQALLHELAASLPPGPALAAALVQALRHGPPGNDIDTTDHSKRIAALGVPQSKHDDVLVATSFEAFVEHESARRELDTAWLWRRAPDPGGSDEEHRCLMQRQGWPTDADARNAIAYWRQLLQASRFGLNGIVATEGASAISRSLLEQQRRKRRAGQLERSYAAITPATHESGNNPASSLAVLSTSGDDADLLVTDAEKTLFLLDYRRELVSDGIPAEPLDREGIRLTEIACERHAVGCAVAAQAGSVTVRCTYDRKGRLQMDDDEPGNETSWTHEASLRKRTEYTFAGRLTALLEPAAGPSYSRGNAADSVPRLCQSRAGRPSERTSTTTVFGDVETGRTGSILPIALREPVHEEGPVPAAKHHQYAEPAGAARSPPGDPLLDDATAKIGVDQALPRAFHGLAQRRIADALASGEARERLGLERAQSELLAHSPACRAI